MPNEVRALLQFYCTVRESVNNEVDDSSASAPRVLCLCTGNYDWQILLATWFITSLASHWSLAWPVTTLLHWGALCFTASLTRHSFFGQSQPCYRCIALYGKQGLARYPFLGQSQPWRHKCTAFPHRLRPSCLLGQSKSLRFLICQINQRSASERTYFSSVLHRIAATAFSCSCDAQAVVYYTFCAAETMLGSAEIPTSTPSLPGAVWLSEPRDRRACRQAHTVLVWPVVACFPGQ